MHTPLHRCVSMCMYTLVRVGANAARLSYFQVHVSPQGINCCELSDGSAAFVQPLMRRWGRSGDKWEVVSQSVFILRCPITVHTTHPLSFSQHTLSRCFALLHLISTSQSQPCNNYWSGQRRNALLGQIILLKSRQTVAPFVTYHPLIESNTDYCGTAATFHFLIESVRMRLRFLEE